MTRGWFLVLAALAAPPPLTAGTVYKWVDETGRTHYSQKKPAGDQARPIDLRPNLIPGLSAEELREAQQLDAKKAAKKAPPEESTALPAARVDGAAATAECGTNPAAGCPMVDAPPGAPMFPDDPFERLGTPSAIPALP
jgi:hypothetical protein